MSGTSPPDRISGPGRRRGLLTAVALAGAGLVFTLIGVPGTESGLLGRLSNTTDTASTNGYYTCTAAAVGASGLTAYLAYPFSEASGTTATDVSGNNRPGTYTAAGITYTAAGPCPRDSGKAVTLNGSTGYITGAPTPTNPQTFSVEIWFKTSTGGGKLIGLGTAATGASGQYDRHLYLTNTGKLIFGVYPGSVQTITTTATYLDGAWHNAIATLAPSTDANPGMRLYVDGALLASNPAVTSAESASGYWRIGYDNLSGWPNAPTNYYFTGSLAYASTYSYALTPAQALAHYRAGK